MLKDLKPYAEMKPSGLPWLGEVPAHWTVRRIKTLLKEIDHRTQSGQERLLSLRMRHGLVDHHNAGGRPIPPEALVGFKMVEPGHIVMNRMRAAFGLFGLADVHGLVSPDYAVFQTQHEVFDRYLVEAFKLPSLGLVFRAESKGLGTGESGFLRLYTDRFGAIPVPYPPPDEQRLIVRFLDWHGAQTAKLVRAKKKIIALLNEQKQAIIHQAVTRGLDPNVKLTPSGVPWLGDVPEGWDVKPLKHWARINQRTLSQNTEPDYLFDYLDISSVRTGYLSSSPERLRFASSPSRARRIVKQGDTLISTVRTYLRAIYHVDREWPDLIASTGFAVLTPASSIDARFFGFVLQSKVFVDQVVANSIGVAYPAISESRLGSLHVCLPPLRLEQEAIIKHLEVATIDFDKSINATQREITLIQEFRTRLIADVVTGKLDVRALAASLPDITEFESADDFADEGQLDENLDDADDEAAA